MIEGEPEQTNGAPQDEMRRNASTDRRALGALGVALCAGLLGGAGGRASSSSGSSASTICGWHLHRDRSGRASQPESTGRSVSRAIAELKGWQIVANRLDGEGWGAPGVSLPGDVGRCWMLGTGDIRIVSPDGRYITGETMTGTGSPAMSLYIWPGGSDAQSASVVGDGWRMHGAAIYVNVADDEVEVIAAQSSPVESRRAD